MSNCKLIDVLSKLRKSSKESIDNTEVFDDFKNYMHVERKAETDLINLIKNVNASGRKTLILLCGSAGDGKSHLLAYLKNKTDLLNNYIVINDATESDSPTQTAIETLNNRLKDFSDENIDKPGSNLVLAINLGVLNNFIDTNHYGLHYDLLKSFVERNKILTNHISDKQYTESDYFQSISFSDYHMYSLTENGIKTDYISSILSKIFDDNLDNVFSSVASSKTCHGCGLNSKCPVMDNFYFLKNKQVRNYISQLLVKTIIADKTILTTRELLNFIHDILIPADFSYEKFIKALDDKNTYFKLYLLATTPVLLFESNDVSTLLNNLQKYDPLLIRTDETDKNAVDYYVTEDVSTFIKSKLEGYSYFNLINNNENYASTKSDSDIKKIIFNICTRIMNIEEPAPDLFYNNYLKYLFYCNIGAKKQLKGLYDEVTKAVLNWCGSKKQAICLKRFKNGFSLYEWLDFTPYLDDLPQFKNLQQTERFYQDLHVCYIFYISKGNLIVPINIDFNLYQLIRKLEYGYVPTAEDKNHYADFIAFTKKLLLMGSYSENLIIVDDNGQETCLIKDQFGYKFEVK